MAYFHLCNGSSKCCLSMIHMPDCADVEVWLGPGIHVIPWSTEAPRCVAWAGSPRAASTSCTPLATPSNTKNGGRKRILP